MKPLTGLILLWALIGSGVAAQTNTPVYSVAFPVERNSTVATLYTDGTWQVTPFPGSVFAQVDVFHLKPVWSPDGKILYGTVPAEGYDPLEITMMPDLYTLDILSGQAAPFMQLFDPAEINSFAEAVYLKEISPDGHYGWAERIFAPRGYLIDLQTRAVLYESPCWGTILRWTDTQVMVYQGITFACDTGKVYGVELATGQEVYTLPHNESLVGYEPSFPLQNGDMVFGSSQLYYFDVPDSVTVLGELGASGLAVSESQQYLAFEDNKQLIRVDLTTLERTVIEDDFIGDGLSFEGETLIYWRLDGRQVYRAEVTPDGTSTRQTLDIPPDVMGVFGDVVVVGLALDHFQVVGLDGVIFDSATLPDYHLEAYPDFDGTWIHFRAAQPDGTLATVSVNKDTGEVRTPPQPGFLYGTSSPDGAWWLYVGHWENSSDYTVDTLLAVEVATGKTVTLLAGQRFSYNFHFHLGDHFVWG